MCIVHVICINIRSAFSVSPVSVSTERTGLFVKRKQQVDSRWDVRFMSSFICFPPLDLWVCHELLKHAGQAKGPDKAERDRLTTHWPAQMHQRTLNLKPPTMDREETYSWDKAQELNYSDLQKYSPPWNVWHFVMSQHWNEKNWTGIWYLITYLGLIFNEYTKK